MSKRTTVPSRQPWSRHYLAALCTNKKFIAACLLLVGSAGAATADPVTKSPPSLKVTKPDSSQASLVAHAPATIPKQADLVFLDNFEYIVGRSDANAAKIFKQSGRWSWVKTMQSGGRGNGYLYTVGQIPGYNGVFPGGNSNRVLAMEALPDSLGFQTDFYLQYGDGENSAFNNAIPGNVWFQFWIYVNHYGDQLSHIHEGKFIYPCDGPYPCHRHKWLLTLSAWSALPLMQSLGAPTKGDAYLNNPVSLDTTKVVNPKFPSWDLWKLGQTNTSERITANRWTLVKIHLDTSSQSGKYEAWMRPVGKAWVKVAEWIDGVTPGFSWRILPEFVGGHRVIRMPTTIGRANPAGQSYDAWLYLDDFAIARTEAGLPLYNR